MRILPLLAILVFTSALLPVSSSFTQTPGNPSSFKLTGTLVVGKAPHGIRFSSDGARAYVALAGEGKIAVVDLPSMQVAKTIDTGGTPLDLIELAGNDRWAVIQFRSDELVSLAKDRDPWKVGRSPSLFAPQVINGLAYVSCEFGDQLAVFDTKTEQVVASFPTGKQPYPADVTPDGVLAFVPNRADGTVSVIDLLNKKTLATPKVGEKPEGGALTADGVSYIVACGGSNELVYINTASFQVTARISAGVGPRPFSVAITRDGRFGVVNNAGGDTVSILDVAGRKIIGSVKAGEKPIVVRMHPDGRRVFIASEDSGTLSVLEVPPALPKKDAGKKNEVVVMGMIHGQHRTSQRYGLDAVRKLIRAINPDYTLVEIPPNRFDAAMSEFQATGSITEPRVKVFPEYVDVMFPLTKEMRFQIVPTAGWTSPMNEYRNAVLKRISNDPNRKAQWDEYQQSVAKSDAAVKAGGAEDDPRWIHTDGYDAAHEIEYSVYNQLFNDEIGPGGWDNINAAHYANIARALDEHHGEGKRFLITYGAGHKGWFLRHLRKRKDIVLLDLAKFLNAVSLSGKREA